jgi:hypothetical protein
MRRTWPVLIAIVLLGAGVSLPLLLLAQIGGDDDSGNGASPRTTPSASPTAVESFVPPTYEEGDRTVMPVVFPDGTNAEVVYPEELDLDALNVYPNTQAMVPHRDCGWDLFISRDRLAAGVRGSEPLAVYEGTSGPVELWEGDKDHGGYWLLFRFGSWTVAAPCNRDPARGGEDYAIWASSLTGQETLEGYLILDAAPPLKLHPDRGTGGPALFMSGHDVFVELVAGSTNKSEDRDPSDGVVQWWFTEGHVRLYATAFSKDAKDLLRGIVEGLEVRTVPPA